MNNRDKKKIARLMKKGIKKNQDSFHPNTVSIKGICEELNHPEYLDQIANRLSREYDSNSSVWDHVYIGLDTGDDVRLDAEGLKLCSEMLASYIDADKITDLYDYMINKDSCDYAEYKLQLGIKCVPSPDLRKSIELYQDVIISRPDLTDAATSLIEKIRNELKSRRSVILKGKWKI